VPVTSSKFPRCTSPPCGCTAGYRRVDDHARSVSQKLDKSARVFPIPRTTTSSGGRRGSRPGRRGPPDHVHAAGLVTGVPKEPDLMENRVGGARSRIASKYAKGLLGTDIAVTAFCREARW